MNDLDRALLLLASVRTALLNGTRHYDEAGNLLPTEEKVLEALHEGTVRIDNRGAAGRTDLREVYACLRETTTRH